MSVRLLLDEMFHPRIASELTSRGHDCLAVAAEPDLRESDDADLLAYALEQRRTLVTNNVVDFERLRRQRDHTGKAENKAVRATETEHEADLIAIDSGESRMHARLPWCGRRDSNPHEVTLNGF